MFYFWLIWRVVDAWYQNRLILENCYVNEGGRAQLQEGGSEELIYIQMMFRLVGRSARVSFGFSAGHGHRPSKPVFAPKVEERMIHLNVYNDGTFERIPAYIGESLLEALQRFNFSTLPGYCQGGEQLDSMLEDPIQPNTFGPQCTSCQVLVMSPWVEKLRPRHNLEEYQLNKTHSPSEKYSRLACCIKLDKWMDEMQVSIPFNQVEEDE